MEKLYTAVKTQIDRVDFSKLWADFKPLKFALYTDQTCFLDGAYIEKTEAFLANTSIFYNGEWIAIWYVQEDMDPVVLASKLIHEMFHGFQRMHGESRFPDDLDALYHYRYEEENLNLKAKENQLLCSLLTGFDQETFAIFLQIRKYRAEAFSYAYRYESCVEQIEGTANYVELCSLRQMSAELFKKRLLQIQEHVMDPSNLLPIRGICYDTGTLLLYVMKQNKMAYDEGFSAVTISENMLGSVEGKKYPSEYSTKDMVDSFYLQAVNIIRKAVEKHELVMETPCDILALNVYDAVFCDDHIISRYFVMFGSEENPRLEYGDFVVETRDYKKATKIYRI